MSVCNKVFARLLAHRHCNVYVTNGRVLSTYRLYSSNTSDEKRLIQKSSILSSFKLFSTEPTNEQNLGLVARFKQMYKDYWYVLVPVHLVTSVCWFGGFYYLAKSGVDVVALMKSVGISDRFVDPLKDSSMGYYALTYAMYKIATPIRYTVTLGGTTFSIKYLKNLGYIKPMPSREKMKEMFHETKQELKQRKHQFRERKGHVLQDIARYKQEIKNIKRNEVKNDNKN